MAIARAATVCACTAMSAHAAVWPQRPRPTGLRGSIDGVLAWDFHRVLPGHGDIIESGGHRAAAAGLGGWLPPGHLSIHTPRPGCGRLSSMLDHPAAITDWLFDGDDA